MDGALKRILLVAGPLCPDVVRVSEVRGRSAAPVAANRHGGAAASGAAAEAATGWRRAPQQRRPAAQACSLRRAGASREEDHSRGAAAQAAHQAEGEEEGAALHAAAGRCVAPASATLRWPARTRTPLKTFCLHPFTRCAEDEEDLDERGFQRDGAFGLAGRRRRSCKRGHALHVALTKSFRVHPAAPPSMQLRCRACGRRGVRAARIVGRAR